MKNINNPIIKVIPGLMVSAVVAWAASVVYAVITMYKWGYYADEHGLAGRLGAYEIVVILVMILLFLFMVTSFHFWRVSRQKLRRYPHKVLVTLAIVTGLLVVPFTFIILFFLGHVFLVLLR